MIALISAVAKNGVIGSNNKLVWRNKEDANHFRDLTTGKIVVMGKKTFESIFEYLKGPLSHRTNVVLARKEDNYQVPAGVLLYHTIPDALAAHAGKDIFIAGGGEIYRQTIDLADRLYITHIDQEFEGDTRFPPIDPKKWRLASEEKHDGYNFAVYEKI